MERLHPTQGEESAVGSLSAAQYYSHWPTQVREINVYVVYHGFIVVL